MLPLWQAVYPAPPVRRERLLFAAVPLGCWQCQAPDRPPDGEAAGGAGRAGPVGLHRQDDPGESYFALIGAEGEMPASNPNIFR
jgi:hypothetical protein